MKRTIAKVAVGLSIVTFVSLGFILPRFRAAKFGESQLQCADNLELIATALKGYQSKYGKQPDSLADLISLGLKNEALICPSPKPTEYLYAPGSRDILVSCSKHKVHKDAMPFRITADLKTHTYREY